MGLRWNRSIPDKQSIYSPLPERGVGGEAFLPARGVGGEASYSVAIPLAVWLLQALTVRALAPAVTVSEPTVRGSV